MTSISHGSSIFIMSECDGCDESVILDFDNLPYENKVIFVHKLMPNIKSAYYIPNTETHENGVNCVVPLTNTVPGEYKRYIDNFDYISFLNGNLKK